MEELRAAREAPELHQGDLRARMRQSRPRGLRRLSQEGSSRGRESEEELPQGSDVDFHAFLTGPLQGSSKEPRDWNALLSGWLLNDFDPTALLTRKATTQAPSKAAQDDWDRINCAVLGLAKQFMIRNEAGGIEPNQFYDQLLTLHRVLPMLILRRDRGNSQDIFDKNVLSRCNLFLKGEWARL